MLHIRSGAWIYFSSILALSRTLIFYFFKITSTNTFDFKRAHRYFSQIFLPSFKSLLSMHLPSLPWGDWKKFTFNSTATSKQLYSFWNPTATRQSLILLSEFPNHNIFKTRLYKCLQLEFNSPKTLNFFTHFWAACFKLICTTKKNFHHTYYSIN